MTRNENQDAFRMKRLKTCDNDGQSPWSDLNHDLLYLVMVQVGVFYFSALSGVCKSWRSFALSNKSKFMESRSLVYISISTESNEEDFNYYLEDNEGRSFSSILPHSGGRTCVGFTCGQYLILFGSKTHDFWLLNPLTRHGVHFPDIPPEVSDDPAKFKAFIVLSPSKSGWVLAMTDRSPNIWFSIAGQGTWNHVSSTFPIVGLGALKGKMYALDNARHLCELKLNPEPKLTSLETKNFPILFAYQRLVCTSNCLFVTGCLSDYSYKHYRLDFEEMKWVSCKTINNAGSSSCMMLKHSAVVKHGQAKSYFLYKYGTP